MKQHDYYIVAIGNSTRMDRTPSPDEDCGHKHRSSAAAKKCQKKLIGPKCYAKWYNSYILGARGETFDLIR